MPRFRGIRGRALGGGGGSRGARCTQDTPQSSLAGRRHPGFRLHGTRGREQELREAAHPLRVRTKKDRKHAICDLRLVTGRCLLSCVLERCRAVSLAAARSMGSVSCWAGHPKQGQFWFLGYIPNSWLPRLSLLGLWRVRRDPGVWYVITAGWRVLLSVFDFCTPRH